MFYYKNILLALSLVFLGTYAFAQSPTEEGLDDEELEIVKSFNANLLDADKKQTLPSLPPMEDEQREETYQIPAKLLEIEYDAPSIRPLAMRKETPPKVFPFYSKLGFGFPFGPFAEVIYNNTDTPENFDIYGRLKHHSASNNKKVQNQRFSENLAEVKGKYFLENGMALDANLGFNLDKVFFYGYNDEDTTFAKEDAAQRFTTFDFGLGVGNAEATDAGFNYHGGLSFYTHGDKFDAKEVGIKADVDLEQWFDEKHHLNLAIKESFRNFNDTVGQGNNLIAAIPSFTYHQGIFKARAGIYLGYDGNFSVFPDVEVTLGLLDGKVSPFVGWTGEIQQNSFRSVTDYNPFVESQFNLQNSTVQRRYGGVRGKISTFDYELRVTQGPIKNAVLVVNDSIDSRRFDVVYEEKLNVVRAHATVSATIVEKFRLLLSGNYNFYNSKSEIAPWHMPNFEANLEAKYSPIEKLDVKAALYMAGGTAYKNELGEKENLKALLDLSLGAKYQVKPNFGVFFDVNNLISSKYQRWNKYPQYGLNFMGGVLLKF